MEQYKKLLSEYISFKSISTDTAFLPEIKKTVAWLEDFFKSNSFSVDIVKGEHSNPVIWQHIFKTKI